MKKTIKKEELDTRDSLINSELRYRRLFETAQDGILILDAATGAITDVNPFLINMLGYSREEFIEKKLWEVGAFQDIKASKHAFQALQENEYIRYKNLPLRAKDGKPIQVEFVSNVYQEGDAKVIQCNIRNITNVKTLRMP
jgi:PAS domain S-box-containing protein